MSQSSKIKLLPAWGLCIAAIWAWHKISSQGQLLGRLVRLSCLFVSKRDLLICSSAWSTSCQPDWRHMGPLSETKRLPAWGVCIAATWAWLHISSEGQLLGHLVRRLSSTNACSLLNFCCPCLETEATCQSTDMTHTYCCC